MASEGAAASTTQGHLAQSRSVDLPAMNSDLLLKLGTVYLFGVLLLIGIPSNSSLLIPALTLGVAFCLGTFVSFYVIAYEHGWGAPRVVTISALGVRLEAAGVRAPALRISRDRIASMYVDDERVRLLDSRGNLLLEIDEGVLGSAAARAAVATAVGQHLPAVKRVTLGTPPRAKRLHASGLPTDSEE